MSSAPSSPSPSTHIVTTLYALGSNGNFQLGLSHNQDINAPQKCIFDVSESQSLVTDTTLTIADSRLSTSTSSSSLSQAQFQTHIPLHPNESISKVSTGGNHTHILTTQGRVYAVGSNTHYQLGLYPPSSPISSAAPISPTPGFHHLPWTGPPTPGHITPTTVHSVTHLTSTFTATIFVSSYTTVFTVGHGPKGELGLGAPGLTDVSVPTRAFDIRDLEDVDSTIKAVSGCIDHVLVLSSRGIVYGFGSCRRGKLGRGVERDRDEDVGDGDGSGIWWGVQRTGMERTLESGRAAQIGAGREFSVICGVHGEVVVFGKGYEKERESDGRIRWDRHWIQERDRNQNRGQDHDHDHQESETNNMNTNGGCTTSSTPSSSIRPTLHTGWSSVTLYHPHHQPLHTILSSSRPTQNLGQQSPSTLPPVTLLSVGSEHSVALLTDGSVVAWGWGEHGNCGRDVDGRGVVGGRWNVLWDTMGGNEGEGVRRRKMVGVGAGCGSSFFWVEEEMDGRR